MLTTDCVDCDLNETAHNELINWIISGNFSTPEKITRQMPEAALHAICQGAKLVINNIILSALHLWMVRTLVGFGGSFYTFLAFFLF